MADFSVARIFTDGSKTPKRSGWGVVVEKGRFSIIFKGEKKGATNNEMELFAFKVALEKGRDARKKFCIFSDSQYSLKIFFAPKKEEKDTAEFDCSKIGGWVKNWSVDEKRPNIDLILEIKTVILEILKKKIPFEVHWVRGHHLCKGNILADLCAKGLDETTKIDGYI